MTSLIEMLNLGEVTKIKGISRKDIFLEFKMMWFALRGKNRSS